MELKNDFEFLRSRNFRLNREQKFPEWIDPERVKTQELGGMLVAFIVWGLCGAAGELPPLSPRQAGRLVLYTLW